MSYNIANMKNTQKGSMSVVLLVIIIVILLGVIGYSYLKPTQPQVAETASQVVADQQNVNESVKPTPKVTETTKINNTVPAVNTAPELLTYSGKTDNGVNFSIKYPTSWTYYKFNCNAGGVAFWPKNIAPDFSKGGACSMNSFLDSAPIIVSTMSQPQIQLKNNSYQTIYSQMKSSLSF